MSHSQKKEYLKNISFKQFINPLFTFHKSWGLSWSPSLLFVSLGMEVIKKVMTRNQMMRALTAKGVKVCGTTQEFGTGGEGIWISGEDTSELFNYWHEGWGNTFGVEPKLDAFVQKNGWYFEWYDAGTMMAYAI